MFQVISASLVVIYDQGNTRFTIAIIILLFFLFLLLILLFTTFKQISKQRDPNAFRSGFLFSCFFIEREAEISNSTKLRDLEMKGTHSTGKF